MKIKNLLNSLGDLLDGEIALDLGLLDHKLSNKNKHLLNSLGGLLDGEIALDLGLVNHKLSNKNKNLLNSLGGLLDGEVALDLGLVDPVDGDPGEVAPHHHRPQGVPLPGVGVKVENL
jgi:hypothetical protein